MQENTPNNHENAHNVMSETMKRVFAESVQGTATLFALDTEDLRNAYESKPESLNAIFNSASTAKSDRNKWVGWSVAWTIIMWPIALYTGFKALESHNSLGDIKDQVVREIDRANTRKEFTEKNDKAAPPSKGPRNFGPRNDV